MIKSDKMVPAVNKVTPFNNHVAKMEKRLTHWKAELDKLAQTALSVEVAQKEAFDKRVTDLQAKLDRAQDNLEALRGAGEHKWDSFKEALELSVRELEKAFKS